MVEESTSKNTLSEREMMFLTALRQAKKIVTMYNLETDSFEYIDGMCKLFGLNNNETINFYTLMKNEIVATKSLSLFNRFIEKMSLDIEETREKMLLKETDGLYHWYNVIFTKISPKKVVISFQNFQSNHKKEISHAFYLENGNSHLVIGHNIENGKIFSIDGAIGARLETEDFIDKNILVCARERFFHVDDIENYSEFFDGTRLQKMYNEDKKIDRMDIRIIDKAGQSRWVNILMQILKGPYSGELIAIATFSDINDEKNQHLELEQQAQIDTFTGALHKSAFFSGCNRRLKNCANDGFYAFLVISVQGIGKINSELGSNYTDQVLESVALTISSTISSEDIVGKISSSEFGLLLCNAHNQDIVDEKIRILSNSIARKVENEFEITAEIGCAINSVDGNGVEELYQKACEKLHYSKKTNEDDDIIVENSYLTHQNTPIVREKYVEIRTFGYFDIFINGTPISFKSAKAKELLALLVDRRGGFINSNEAITFLYEDDADPKILLARYRKVIMNLNRILQEYEIEDIVDTKNNERRIVVENVDCDYYNFLQGKASSQQLFKGAYMSNYSWSESTLASLESAKNMQKN